MTPSHHIPIAIIGAGISGLTLARALLARSIPSVIYERALPPSQSPRHNYGITLSSSTYNSLLDLIDGRSLSPSTSSPLVESLRSNRYAAGQTRLHRGRLEACLAESLDIRWDHRLSSATLHQDAHAEHDSLGSDRTGPTRLHFSNGREVSASLVIGADGVHSFLRTQVTPSQTLHVLPYVVFRGKAKLPLHAFKQICQDLVTENVAELRRDGYTLRILVDDVSDQDALLSWTYSRPARGPEDALFNPTRGLDEARIIPESLYEEIEGIQDLEEPFKAIFNIKEVRRTMIQHWLMRDIIFDEQELKRLAKKGMVFLGDAAHAMPILGSRGADSAVQDALDLANCLADHGGPDIGSQEKMTNAINEFYKRKVPISGGSSSSWKVQVEGGEKRLAAMHLTESVIMGNL